MACRLICRTSIKGLPFEEYFQFEFNLAHTQCINFRMVGPTFILSNKDSVLCVFEWFDASAKAYTSKDESERQNVRVMGLLNFSLWSLKLKYLQY